MLFEQKTSSDQHHHSHPHHDHGDHDHDHDDGHWVGCLQCLSGVGKFCCFIDGCSTGSEGGEGVRQLYHSRHSQKLLLISNLIQLDSYKKERGNILLLSLMYLLILSSEGSLE